MRHHQNVLIDELSYRYAQGRLENVRDMATARLSGNADFADGTFTNTTAVEFSYDVAGNVLLDQNRSFAAEYNRLNRVTRLVGPGGTNAHESFFAYDGLGRLRSERTLNPVENPQSGQQRSERVRYFAQGLTLRADVTLAYQSATNEWAQVASTIVIDRVDGSAGYWTSGKWHFSITDQVGTPRVIFNQDGQVVERNHTYPYGLRHAAWSSAPTGTPEEEGFAGGERVANELAVTWQRNGARLYDAVLGRFLGVEPLADRLVTESVYLYSGGDPVNYSDPDGRRKRKKKEEATNERVDENEESVDEHAEQEDGQKALEELFLGFLLELFENWREEQTFTGDQIDGMFRSYLEHAGLVVGEQRGERLGVNAFWEIQRRIPLDDMHATYASAGDDGFDGREKNASWKGPEIASSTSVGQPGIAESFIPVWGSGRAAVDDFQNGRYGWGALNTAMAISDVFLVKSLFQTGAKAVFTLGKSTQRVFWSGEGTKSVAEMFAKNNGMVTLEMTRAGRNLSKLTAGLSRDISGRMWDRLSRTYAQGAGGTVHVFQNYSKGVRVNSTWARIEFPVLKSNNTKIVFHNID